MKPLDSPSASQVWRILVVENDPVQRADQLLCLQQWGYEPVVAEAEPEAEDKCQSLRADVLHKMRTGQFDLALIDQRLTSDVNPSDYSGLELAEELAQATPPLPSIIVSGYPPPSALLSSSAVIWHYVGKEAGADALKNAIDTAIQRASVSVA